MSELADLTAASDSTAIPGYVLSRLDIGDFGELESALEARALALATGTAANLPQQLGERLMLRVIDDCLSGLYSYGSSYFREWARSARGLPALAHLSLRHKHGDKVTLEAAAEMLKQHPGAENAVLKMAGIETHAPKKTDPPTADPSRGESSSNPPAPADSATAKSAA